MGFDVQFFREQFPFFQQSSIIYLDNAATTQKLGVALDAQYNHAIFCNANVHRAAYPLAVKATNAYEQARERVAHFLGAQPNEIIFTRGTTEGLNLAAFCLQEQFQEGDIILLTTQEHHSNIVPWQQMAKRTGAKIDSIPVNADGQLNMDVLRQKLSMPQVKLLAITHVSNVLGFTNDIRYICSLAKSNNVLTVVDGAQAVLHHKINVSELACDIYTFSGHKMYAPDGIGAVYISAALAEILPPFQGGGEMIHHVSLAKSEFKISPYKFEAGTPYVSGAVALARAIEFIEKYRCQYQPYIEQLAMYAMTEIRKLPVQLLNNGEQGIISFVCQHDAFDIAHLLGEQNICVRAGKHCAEPLLNALGHLSTIRISLAPYNNKDEVSRCLGVLKETLELLSDIR